MKPPQRRHHGPPSRDRWLVSYADFMTLLFAFFTTLYA
ncbi:MAG: flagellar motor protein MotB, partial [Vicinamibacterales bacterium]